MAKPKQASDYKSYGVRDTPGGPQRFIGLRDSDFSFLAKAAGQGCKVDTKDKTQAKLLAELQRQGVIRFAFRQDQPDGWPYTVARLTPLGAQCLAQDPAAYSRGQ